MEPWRTVIRIRGHVECRIGGTDDWAPIFRTRMLSDGDFFRVLPNSEAHLKYADGTFDRFACDVRRPEGIIIAITEHQLTAEGRWVVFKMMVGKHEQEVLRYLGVSDCRFEVKTPNGTLAARG